MEIKTQGENEGRKKDITQKNKKIYRQSEGRETRRQSMREWKKGTDTKRERERKREKK